VIAALERVGGAARSADLPVSRRSVQNAVVAGRVIKRAPGLVALPGCRDDVLAAVACGAVLSCLSAAKDHGLPVLGEPPRVHVTAPRGSERIWRRVEIHRRTVRHDGRRTDLLQTVLDCLRCAPVHEAVAIADHAVRHELLTMADLSRAGAGLGENDRARRRLGLVDPRAGSPPESWARVFLVIAGYRVDVQVFIDEVGWIDILVDGWLVIEIDGREYHAGERAFANDRRRDRAAYPQGYVVIRFPGAEVLRREYFLAEVERVHQAGPPRK
jgi:very-short-patch-repair endonuclease